MAAANSVFMRVVFLPPSHQVNHPADDGRGYNCPCGSEIDISQWFTLKVEPDWICHDFEITCGQNDNRFTIRGNRVSNILAVLGQNSCYWCFCDSDDEDNDDDEETSCGIFCNNCMPAQFIEILEFVRDGERAPRRRRNPNSVIRG